MFHFFGLPRSVRKQIYEYCLVVGEIDPFPTDHEWKAAATTSVDKPAVALLRAHPWIEAEARDILYGGNVWLMLSKPQSLVEKFFWTCHRKDFRHVRVSFSQHDLITRDWVQENPCVMEETEGSRHARTEQSHQVCSTRLIHEWTSKIGWLLYPELPNLKRLDMDLHQCYCPIGCCRLVDRIISIILTAFLTLSQLTSDESKTAIRTFSAVELNVIGTQSADEKRRFNEAIAVFQSRDVPRAEAMRSQARKRLLDLENS